MEYTGVITNFSFIPLVNVVPTTLRIWITIEQNGLEIMIEERGTIKELSQKFKFIIEGSDNYDFNGFLRRKCNIIKDLTGYHFDGFI